MAAAGQETIPGMPSLLDSELEEVMMRRHITIILAVLFLIGSINTVNILTNPNQFNESVWANHLFGVRL